MAKSYSVELKKPFFELHKIPPKINAIWACKKSGWVTEQNFETKTSSTLQARLLLEISIHTAGAYIFAMSCVGYARAAKKLFRASLRSFPRNKNYTHDFCQTFTSCYVSCNVLKHKIKRIGPHVRLRDIIVSSYPITPCNFA